MSFPNISAAQRKFSYHLSVMKVIHWLLGLSCILLGVFSESSEAFMIAVCLGSLCGLIMLLRMLTNPGEIRLFYLLSISLLLGYAFSTLLYMVNFFSFYGYIQLIGINFPGYTQLDLSIALVLIYVSASLLTWLSRFERPLFAKVNIHHLFEDARTRIFVFGITAFTFLSFFIWESLGYMGIQTQETGNISAPAEISAIFATIIPSLLLLILFQVNKIKFRLIIIFSIFLSFFITAVMGRRVLLYTLLTSVLVYVMRSSKGKMRYTGRHFFIGLFALFLLYYGFVFFFSMRNTIYALGTSDVHLEELLIQTFKFMKNGGGDFNNSMRLNLIERPFILPYVAVLLSGLERSQPLYGSLMIWAMKLAIPSAIMPDKMNNLSGDAETLIHPQFGLPIFDGPDSIITAGIADFGFVGAVLYPVFMVICYLGLIRFVGKFSPPFVLLFVILSLVFHTLYIEEGLNGLLTSTPRDLLLVAIIMTALWKFFSPARRS